MWNTPILPTVDIRSVNTNLGFLLDSFIHQVINIPGLNKLCSHTEDGIIYRQGVKSPLTDDWLTAWPTHSQLRQVSVKGAAEDEISSAYALLTVELLTVVRLYFIEMNLSFIIRMYVLPGPHH